MSKIKNKIIVLQGVPASGKSTWARTFVEANPQYVIVSRDSIRESRGQYWIPEQENYISKIEEFQIKAAIEENLNVIIDATNLNPKTIKKWNDLATTLDVSITYKKFDISYEEALKRDSNRPRSVGKAVMNSFFSKYYPKEFMKINKNSDIRNIKVPESHLPNCIICDIDGTVALRVDRSPYDQKKVIFDNVDPRMQQLLSLITTTENPPQIFFFSGREGTQQCMEDTHKWIKKHFSDIEYRLYMRKEKDYRKDNLIKKELYEQYIQNKFNVLGIFDDRNQVVDMWRELGLLTFQVYYGNF